MAGERLFAVTGSVLANFRNRCKSASGLGEPTDCNELLAAPLPDICCVKKLLGFGIQSRKAPAQLLPQFVLDLGLRQACSSIACDQVFPAGIRPLLCIIIECYPLPRLSALSVFLNLHTPVCSAEHR